MRQTDCDSVLESSPFQIFFLMSSIYHDGERTIQQKVGEEIIANSNGRVITNNIIKGAINFIEKQPMFIVSSVDQNKNIWISLLIGDYGFVAVPTSNSLSINKDLIYSDKNDIFFNNIAHNSSIGSLFIELDTRRRFRINGNAKEVENQINLTVEEAYPNCPKYIQQRVISSPENFTAHDAKKTKGNSLNDELKEMILSADTLFVGSQSSNKKMDASHRGGKKGFVEILSDGTLKIPDYQGNSMYNTLGNLVQNDNCGLLFVDFENRTTLQLTGRAKLLFDQTSEQDLLKTSGTGRYWLFEIDKWIFTQNHHQVNWEFLSYSPFNP